MLKKLMAWFRRGSGPELPEHDAVGPVLSQLYDDILVHREELINTDNPDYQEFVDQASINLQLLAPDEVSKRAVLVILAESLKK